MQWLIVGLGNPGQRYAATRHNVGYMVIDELTCPEGAKCVKPTTYMNSSGDYVAPLARRLGIDAEHIIVCHDELDLPAGAVKLKRGGNENGHNGLKSLTEHLGTRDYLRVRLGIGRPCGRDRGGGLRALRHRGRHLRADLSPRRPCA